MKKFHEQSVAWCLQSIWRVGFLKEIGAPRLGREEQHCNCCTEYEGGYVLPHYPFLMNHLPKHIP